MINSYVVTFINVLKDDNASPYTINLHLFITIFICLGTIDISTHSYVIIKFEVRQAITTTRQ